MRISFGVRVALVFGVALPWSATVLAADPVAKAAQAAASWTLTTDDTRLTVGVGKDPGLRVYELACPAAG